MKSPKLASASYHAVDTSSTSVSFDAKENISRLDIFIYYINILKIFP